MCHLAANAKLQLWAGVCSSCGTQTCRHLWGRHLLRCRSEELAPAQRKAESGSRPLERSCMAFDLGIPQQLPVAVQE